MQKNKVNNYTDSFVEYQGKQYIPGYYIGSKIHPLLKAQTKTGGRIMIIVGIFLFVVYSFQLINNFSLTNIGWVMPISVSLLLIMVGQKFVRKNQKNKNR